MKRCKSFFLTKCMHPRSNSALFIFTTRGCRHEAHLSAVRRPPQAHARFPRSYGDSWWPLRHPRSSCQGPQASRRLNSDPNTSSRARLIARQSFKRCSRLLKAPEFARVFEQRRVRRGRYFSAHWRQRDQTALPEVASDRLGVVIAKKLLRTSVHRNLLKRLCREAFRRRTRPAGSPPVDLVLRLTVKLDAATASRSRKALAEDIDALLNAVAIKAGKP
jgi:ribonuclease P protein component